MSLINELTSWPHDIDGNQTLLTVKGKTLKDLYGVATSLPVGVDSFIVQQNPISTFEVLRYFFEGVEQYSTTLGFNSNKTIGGHIIQPTDNITQLLFQQDTALGNEPIGSTYGIFLAVGGKNVTFSILQDDSNFFAIEDGNLLKSLALVPEGNYDLIIKSEGTGGTQQNARITIEVLATALISSINLSNITVEEGALVGSIVGALSTVGGEDPITYSIAAQFEGEDVIDIFEIDGTSLKTKDNVGLTGDSYIIYIAAEDSRSELPDDLGIKVEQFEIFVLASTFLNTNSLIFNGIDESLRIPHHISLNPDDITVSIWPKAATVLASSTLISKRDTGSTNVGWFIEFLTNGQIQVQINQSNTMIKDYRFGSGLQNNNWQNVIWSYNATTFELKLFANGVEISPTIARNDVFSGPIFKNSIDINIGCKLSSGTPSGHILALIDEVSIFSSAFNETEAAELYNGGVPNNLKANSTGASLVSWWDMGDSYTGTVQPDRNGSNDATGVGITNGNKSTDVPS